MSVTITRRRAIEIGEAAIAEAREYHPALFEDESPEVIAFRQVIAQAPSFARGCCVYDGCGCPMFQTVFRNLDNDRSWALAIGWDSATRKAGLTVFLIHVNPLT